MGFFDGLWECQYADYPCCGWLQQYSEAVDALVLWLAGSKRLVDMGFCGRMAHLCAQMRT